MASAGREPITGAWGQSSHEVQGQSPWLGARKAKPPLKLKTFQALDVEKRQQIFFGNLSWHNALVET